MTSPKDGAAGKPLICASEFDIVHRIFTEETNFHWFLDFMLAPVLGEWWDRRDKRWSFTIICFVERTALGLEPGEQPGDVDVLIVPQRNGRWYPTKTMAIEVKILRLNLSNRNKHPRPSGAQQAKGLVRDGFPYVGLLHLIFTEPSPLEEWKPLMHARIIDDFGHVEILGEFPTDTIGTISAQRQFGRLKQKIDGSCIGANSISLSTNEEGVRIKGYSTLGTLVRPTRNPHINRQLLNRVRQLCVQLQRSGHIRKPKRSNEPQSSTA